MAFKKGCLFSAADSGTGQEASQGSLGFVSLISRFHPFPTGHRHERLSGRRKGYSRVQFNSVQSLSRVRLFVTPWTAVRQASPSITNSWSLLKLMSVESVMPSNHLIHYHPRLLPPSIFPSIRVFSNESVLRIKWPKYWSFSFSISPTNEHPGLIGWTSWISL